MTFKPSEILILDTETTGFSATDEIIQLSAIDANGKTICNTYIRPEHTLAWPNAEKVNNISPAFVAECQTMSELRPAFQNMLNRFKCIVGYNLSFDLRMLSQSGLDTSHLYPVDVMKSYVKHYGIYRRGYKTAKLVEAAKHYGYTYNAHDSLEDVKATLFVLKALIAENKL